MGIGPAPAIRKGLEKVDWSLEDADLLEINEAFAAQYLAVEKELGLDREKVNVNGSGVGLGHPIGCTGARITVSLIHELKRRGLEKGIASLCVGGGIGVALFIEALKRSAIIASFTTQIDDEIIDHDFQRKVSSFGNAQFLLMWIRESLLVLKNI